jgi:hypothetical protein
MTFRIEALVCGRAVLFLAVDSEEKALKNARGMLQTHSPRPGREIIVRRAAEVVARWLAAEESWRPAAEYLPALAR